MDRGKRRKRNNAGDLLKNYWKEIDEVNKNMSKLEKRRKPHEYGFR